MRCVLTALLALVPSICFATEVRVAAGPGALQQAIDQAEAGDQLRLGPGLYIGAITINKPISVFGSEGSHIDGQGKGSVITVSAPDVVVRDVLVTGSGSAHETIDSGIKLVKGAVRTIIENNRLVGNLYGVDIHGGTDARVSNNQIEGRKDFRVNDRGNGVYVWNAPGAIVEGNDIKFGRDGIFTNTSRDDIFRQNRFEKVRFAIHYMYTNDSEVSGNVSVGNDIGYAIMYSTGIRVIGNISDGDRDNGILLNYANKSEFRDNVVTGGAEKCVFIYNANKNTFIGNRFEDCGIGVHFTAGSEGNIIAENAFIANRTQVKYVGTRFVEWSKAGRGNYWSDNLGFDLNNDGVADTPYRPNDIVDQVIWRHPAAKLLFKSPAFQVLSWAQSAFPGLYPGGVRDSAPLMKAPKS